MSPLAGGDPTPSQDRTSELGELIQRALESSDPTAFADLLDPDVRWGPPGDTTSGCSNRGQVLAWYQHAHDAGMRATVTEVVIEAGKVLIGFTVRTDPAAGPAGDERPRWQLLTVSKGRIVDIRGFEDRASAAAFGGL